MWNLFVKFVSCCLIQPTTRKQMFVSWLKILNFYLNRHDRHGFWVLARTASVSTNKLFLEQTKKKIIIKKAKNITIFIKVIHFYGHQNHNILFSCIRLWAVWSWCTFLSLILHLLDILHYNKSALFKYYDNNSICSWIQEFLSHCKWDIHRVRKEYSDIRIAELKVFIKPSKFLVWLCKY